MNGFATRQNLNNWICSENRQAEPNSDNAAVSGVTHGLFFLKHPFFAAV